MFVSVAVTAIFAIMCSLGNYGFVIAIYSAVADENRVLGTHLASRVYKTLEEFRLIVDFKFSFRLVFI